MNFWWWRAYAGYRLARWLLRFAWLVRQPRAWQWMQGQYARMAALGYVPAQSFYGHLLLHRGQGFAVGDEARRLLRLAAQGGRRQGCISARCVGSARLRTGSARCPAGCQLLADG